MNENFENLGPAGKTYSDALLARVAATDPAAGFDTSTLNATLVEDVVASAASAPDPSFVKRQATRFASKLAEAFQARPRFVLGSSLSAIAGVAAIVVFGSSSLGTLLGPTQTSAFSIRPGLGSDTLINGQAPEFSDSKIAGDSLAAGGVNNMLMPFVSYNYNASSELSDETGSAHIYQVAALADPKASLEKIAAELNVQGELHKDQHSTLTSLKDETASLENVPGKSSISMSDKNWWYSAWQGDSKDMNCDNDAPASQKDSCMFVPSESVAKPSKADALARFIKVMKISGFDFDTKDLGFYREHFGSSVSAEYTIDGDGQKVKTGLFFSMWFDAEGNLVSASGALGTVIDKGSFTTISAKDAVARANDKKWGEFTGSVIYSGGMVDGLRKSSPNVGSDVVTDFSGIAVDPMPIATPETYVDAPAEPSAVATAEPYPSPSIQEVTIDKVRFVWMQISDTTGSYWIVPGYELVRVGENVDGENIFGRVPSIPEGLIEF